MKLVFTSKEHKAFELLIPCYSKVCLLYYLKCCCSLSCLWRSQRKQRWLSHTCLEGLQWRTVIHFNIETREEAFLLKLLFLLPVELCNQIGGKLECFPLLCLFTVPCLPQHKVIESSYK